MPRIPLLTTGDVAAHCQVTYETVHNWIDQGKLKACSTPGRQRRILLTDFQQFLAAYGMPPWEETASASPQRKLLIVEDQAELVQTIVEFFHMTTTYAVAAAANGYEAGLQVLSFRPDLVVLDLMLPQMNGLEVCRTIKAMPETRHILVLAMTGYPEQWPRETALAGGADAYLVKPFSLETLRTTVKTLFHQQAMVDGPEGRIRGSRRRL